MLLTLADYEVEAQHRLPSEVAAFLAGGAGGSRSVRRNTAAFERRVLVPRRFVDVSSVTVATTVLGKDISCPVLIAPTGLQSLAHLDGELATARAAAGFGTVMPAAALATYPVEEIVDAAGDAPVWFQFYRYGQDAVDRFIHRAEAAGCAAICVTVDIPRRSRMREHDRRNGFRPTDHATLAHFADGVPELQAVTLPVLEDICARTSLPVVVKGVLRAEDAILAVNAGAAAVVVSNHGGRESGSAPASIDVLASVVDAVDGSAEVYVDGGIRTGDDVAKALALGARAVLIGRPFWWGLAVGGESGVADVLQILRDELIETMVQLGCADICDIDRSFIQTEGA